MTRAGTFHLPVFMILLATPGIAATQNQSLPAPASAQPSTTQASSKVWTNENIGSVGNPTDRSPVVARAKPVAASHPKTVGMKVRNAKWYADQIAALQSRIPPIDAQIAELQSALDGKAAGDGRTSQRPRYAKIDQWPAELKNLQARRQTIIDKIDALRDEARHNGVPPNALP